MKIRTATLSDKDAINRVYINAFPESENELVANLALDLFSDKTVSLVAEKDCGIVGHVAFSPVTIIQNEKSKVYILAPLGVLPQHQNKGTGSKLIQHGIQKMKEMGVNTLLVYGDPNYYARFGFNANIGKHFTPPYDLKFPHGWMGMSVNQDDRQKSPCQISCVDALDNPVLW